MTFECVTMYRCTDCSRIYAELPENCVCNRTVFVKGEQIGSFILVRKVEDTQNVVVRCILCGSLKEVHYSNIRRQKSCGCKPRRINIIAITSEQVTYVCKKCGEAHIEKPPLVTYCCSSEFMEEELDEIDE